MNEGVNERLAGGTDLPKLNDRSRTSWNPGVLFLVGISVHKKGARHSVCVPPLRDRNRREETKPRGSILLKKRTQWSRWKQGAERRETAKGLMFAVMSECLLRTVKAQLPRMLRERENFTP